MTTTPKRKRKTKHEYIKQLGNLNSMRDEMMGEVLNELNFIASYYEHDYGDKRPLNLLSNFIFESDAIAMAMDKLKDRDLIGCWRFLDGSHLWDDVYKLTEYRDLEDTSMDELFEVRDKFVKIIKRSMNDDET
ncbi:MAG: hypothetical protein IJF84_00400 [Thermoguttaceae bacterium]|nr:hypothetical protein [Thermoguttaceae bacterium]